jgi:hypothetical protein
VLCAYARFCFGSRLFCYCCCDRLFQQGCVFVLGCVGFVRVVGCVFNAVGNQGCVVVLLVGLPVLMCGVCLRKVLCWF